MAEHQTSFRTRSEKVEGLIASGTPFIPGIKPNCSWVYIYDSTQNSNGSSVIPIVSYKDDSLELRWYGKLGSHPFPTRRELPQWYEQAVGKAFDNRTPQLTEFINNLQIPNQLVEGINNHPELWEELAEVLQNRNVIRLKTILASTEISKTRLYAKGKWLVGFNSQRVGSDLIMEFQ